MGANAAVLTDATTKLESNLRTRCIAQGKLIPNRGHDLTNQQTFNLTPLARVIYYHMILHGSISARDAMNDYQITGGSLTRRINDLEEEGIFIRRDKKRHRAIGRGYTRYSVDRNDDAALHR